MEKYISELNWGDELEFPSSRAGAMYSHVVGARYPCRSIPYVPRLILDEIRKRTVENVNVLDPFMGSGTTALEANLCSFNVYGLEVDPYARMIGEASVKKFTDKELANLRTFQTALPGLFQRARLSNKYIPDIANIEHWFPEENIKNLARLKRVILEYVDHKPIFESFLLSAFGDIIRAASFAERQSLKPYVSTRYRKQPGEVLPLYLKCMDKYLVGAKSVSVLSEYGAGKINWIEGDATNFEATEKIDVAITSPPYINAMDYVRCIKLESSWVGTGSANVFSEVRSSQLGESARVKMKTVSEDVYQLIKPDFEKIALVDKARAKTVGVYFDDMLSNLRCVYKSLKPGCSYHIIVGNSVVREIDLHTHQYIGELAKIVGFEWTGYFKYQIKDHRTSLPRNGRGGKIEYEHVVSLLKP
jgi:DNA modification methylase